MIIVAYVQGMDGTEQRLDWEAGLTVNLAWDDGAVWRNENAPMDFLAFGGIALGGDLTKKQFDTAKDTLKLIALGQKVDLPKNKRVTFGA